MKSQPLTLRILSYNIHKGFSPSNSKFLLSQIREAIRLVKADIVFLQEVVGENLEHSSAISNWPAQSQFEFLADEVWPHFAYGKNAVYQDGHHGNAILCKYPIVEWENEDVSTNAMEQRGLLHAVIEIPETGRKIDCVCVHLNLLHSGRAIQLERLSARMSRFENTGRPLVIAGDFNDWTTKSSDILLEKIQCHELFLTLYGAHARTFPSFLPLLKLDRIYFRGLEGLDGQVLTGSPWNRLSDHGALFGELGLI